MKATQKIFLSFVGVFLGGWTAWMLVTDQWSLFEPVVIFLLLIIYGVIERGLRILRDAKVRSDLDQQGVTALYAILKPNKPLPEVGGFALGGGNCAMLMRIILNEKPEFIVELGSGVSTVIIAYCIKRLKKGKVVSFEHDSGFAEQTRRMLRYHGLDNIATVIHAPLVEFEGDSEQLWYNKNKVIVESSVDMLFVDGPPRRSAKLARYPAMSHFSGKLSSGAIVMLDDSSRKEEQKIIKKWLEEYDESLKEDLLYSRKGMFVARYMRKNIESK